MPRHAHRARPPARDRVGPVTALLTVLAVVASVVVLLVRDPSPPDTAPVAATGQPTESVAGDLGRPAFPEPTARRTGLSRLAVRSHEPRPTPTATPDREKARQESLARRAAELAAKKAERRKERQQDAAEQPAPFDVRVGTFNVLGSQHTAPGGDRGRFPPASVRSAGAADLIARHGVEILGTQELQDDQLRAIQGRTGLAAWPGLQWGAKETDNSILYDDGRFEFVSGSRFTIPFMGRPRPQPILRLRERATGRELYVVNTHPSAHDGRYLAERRRGQAALVGVVNQLRESGLPVFVTGDMNDREEFYCRVVPPAGLVAANGGGYGDGCHPPPSPIPVDWVVGGGGITWSGYWRDTTSESRRISDHFFVSATAHVG